MLKLLLNIATVGFKGLVSGNKFCILVSKKPAACELNHSLTILVIVETL
jgi:hypothetical protein